MSIDHKNEVLVLKKGFDQEVEIQLEKDNGVADDIAPDPTAITVTWKESVNDAVALLEKTLAGGGVVWQPDSKVGVIGVTLTAVETNQLVVGKVLTQVKMTVDGIEYVGDLFNTKVEQVL